MELIVEVGDDPTNPLIRQELEFFIEIISGLPYPLKISQIIVPIDFVGKINELENRTDYTGKHGLGETAVGVMAKNVIVGENRIILLSQLLFTDLFDSMTRCFIFFHEISHVLNANRFPEIKDYSFRLRSYLDNLYYLYDEYFADRLAYIITERIFKKPSDIWLNFVKGSVESYLSTANDVQYYDQICQEIGKFREHGDVDAFMKKIHESMSVVSITTVHGFARFHHLKDSMSDYVIPQSKFVNKKTIDLMNYYDRKYKESETDLTDGVDLATEYFKSFGVQYEDRDGKGWITVLDIW